MESRAELGYCKGLMRLGKATRVRESRLVSINKGWGLERQACDRSEEFRKSGRADGRGQGSWTVISQEDAKVSAEMELRLWETRIACSRVTSCDWPMGQGAWPGLLGAVARVSGRLTGQLATAKEQRGSPGAPRESLRQCLPYLSSRSSRNCRPWGRVSSSVPQRTPIRVCISLVTPSILATCKDAQRAD